MSMRTVDVAEPPSSPGLAERALGAYVGLAVGDALGATTEFMTPGEIRHRYRQHRDIVGGGWLGLCPGQVTDDTQMSLALGRAILARGGVDAHAVADAFVDWMRGKPIDIGHTVRRGLVHYRATGEPWVERNEDQAGNGACMRSLPVALAYWRAPPDCLQQASRTQAHITHNSAASDAGTEAVLAMLTAVLDGADLDQCRQGADALVARHPAFRFDRRRVQNPSGWIVETLQVVFQALFAGGDFEGVLVDVVNRGGDADTTGAIAGMLAGALYGVDAIPLRWRKALDPAVDSACREQARALLALSGSAAMPAGAMDDGGCRGDPT
jgi:ADP-ribosyl-[dinitrogen reductase] hydrolase